MTYGKTHISLEVYDISGLREIIKLKIKKRQAIYQSQPPQSPQPQQLKQPQQPPMPPKPPYSEIPHAFGCDGWFTARVTTCGEFDQALKAAEEEDTAAYIEVVTDTYAAPSVAKKMHESLY